MKDPMELLSPAMLTARAAEEALNEFQRELTKISSTDTPVIQRRMVDAGTDAGRTDRQLARFAAALADMHTHFARLQDSNAAMIEQLERMVREVENAAAHARR